MQAQNNHPRKPEWLKVHFPLGKNITEVRNIVGDHRLHTVCASARCPNVGDCWNRRTATFLILGNVCTRHCGFCAVKTGIPAALDWQEPERIAAAVQELQLRYAVVTSVTRDDLPDGGAAIFTETIHQIRARLPDCRVEVLTPDFKGGITALDTILAANPDVFNHNIETVPRLYQTVRPQAAYPRSIFVLEYMKAKGLVTKSGLMVGLGEELFEVIEVMKDLRQAGVDLLTIGQYLQPTPAHLSVKRFIPPAEFDWLKQEGLALGFSHVAAAPLVRSSYHADLLTPVTERSGSDHPP